MDAEGFTQYARQDPELSALLEEVAGAAGSKVAVEQPQTYAPQTYQQYRPQPYREPQYARDPYTNQQWRPWSEFGR